MKNTINFLEELRAYAEASKNIKIRLVYKDGKVHLETVRNINNPDGCDAARALVEAKNEMTNEVESAVAHDVVEEEITAPLEQVEEVERVREGGNPDEQGF